MGNTFDVFAGKCNNAAATGLRDISVAGAGKEARVSLSGNCLTLSADAYCSSNATQRSTAACQAFCSITDNGPCDGHGACVPPAPASPTNFTCLCDAGYSALDSGNGSTCAIVNSTTTTTNEKWEGLDVCEQFSLQQMVRAMASLHHSYLVRLLGFCLDQNVETGKQEQILVYEFVGNRDLEYHIYKTKNPLSLRQRLRLAQGAAEGLAYLHGFETPIIHRDIKPANILVTADFQAKVADFGLLKLLTHGESDATRVAGTPGYVDPDYNQTSIITAKSDVNSFGVVLMELLSGMSPQDTNEAHIREWARKKMETFHLDDLKDSRMPEVGKEAIVDIADLALDCMKSPGTRRPSMKDVAYRLTALIEKHCPEKEDNLEGTGKEESASIGGLPSRNISSVLFGDGGRESQRSTGSRPSAISSMSIGSMADGVRSWLHPKPTGGY
ncbi:unnamed protein product [Closterium sp. Naga37s-1]|nr:unnamed protein product [Closterium sp. Naga37s-1]